MKFCGAERIDNKRVGARLWNSIEIHGINVQLQLQNHLQPAVAYLTMSPASLRSDP